jgi:hypothetical protein
VDTYIVILRNAFLVMIGITIFTGFFFTFSNFLVRNTVEGYPER